MNIDYLKTLYLEDLINSLPQNRPIYKDSGLWQIRNDDMEDVIMQQSCSETFKEFVIRYILYLHRTEPEYNILAEIPFRA